MNHSVVFFIIPGHEKVQHWLALVTVATLTLTSLAFFKDPLLWLTSFVLRRGSVLGGENIFPGLNDVLFATIFIDFRLHFSVGGFNFPHLFLLFDFDLY